MSPIRLHPDAETDLADALRHYEAIDTHLRAKFIDKLDEAFSKITASPNLYPCESETAQRIHMQRFPYLIIYEQHQEVVMILAIFHTRRNPDQLHERNRPS